MGAKFVLSTIIREILEVHAPALQLFARQWCECPEDCIQDVVIKISKMESVPENWLPWLYRVVKNEAISLRRKSSRRQKHEQNAGRERQVWFCTTEEGEFDASDLSSALGQLEEMKREIITAKIWGGLTFEQIADAFDCSISTAYERFKSGLEELKRILNRREVIEVKK